MFVYCFVEKCCKYWCKEGTEVFDDGWFDFENIACFVGVDFFYYFDYLFVVSMMEVELGCACLMCVMDVVRGEGGDGL